MKSQIWMANFDLSGVELRCERPFALTPSTDEHRHALGVVAVDGEVGVGVANYIGECVGPQCAIYAKCVAVAVRNLSSATRAPREKAADAELRRLALESK
jgi:hypothetical protein